MFESAELRMSCRHMGIMYLQNCPPVPQITDKTEGTRRNLAGLRALKADEPMAQCRKARMGANHGIC